MTNLRLGIAKFGTNVTWRSTTRTAALLEIKTFIDPFLDAPYLNPQVEFTIYSKRTRNTAIPKIHNFVDITLLTDNEMAFQPIDALVIFHGPYNFYGGAEDRNITSIHRFIRNFQGPVIFVYEDWILPLKDLHQLISTKEWSHKYGVDGLDITERKIKMLTPCTSKANIQEILHRQSMKTAIKFPNENIYSFDLPSNHYGMGKRLGLKARDYLSQIRSYDLSYGGQVRNTYRRKRLQEYYFNSKSNFGVYTFGNLKYFGINNAVSPDKFIENMAKAKATVILADKEYHNCWPTPRRVESVLSGCVPFIDEETDKDHKFYQGLDYLYVKNLKELENKWDDLLPTFPSLVEHVQNIKYYGFNREENSRKFHKLICNLTEIDSITE